MFRYKLRTLLILLAVGPPLLACGWFSYQRAVSEHHKRQERQRLMAAIRAAQAVADSRRVVLSSWPTNGLRSKPKQPDPETVSPAEYGPALPE
jgi:hypothetical protein